MAGEIIRVRSSWVTVIASAATANAAFDAGTKTKLSSTSLTANEQSYEVLDFNLDITVASVAPTENSVVNLYRIPAANTTAEPTPSGSFKPHHVGRFILDDATGANDYYCFGVPNLDPEDTFITLNNSGQTMTYSVLVRARTKKAAT